VLVLEPDVLDVHFHHVKLTGSFKGLVMTSDTRSALASVRFMVTREFQQTIQMFGLEGKDIIDWRADNGFASGVEQARSLRSLLSNVESRLAAQRAGEKVTVVEIYWTSQFDALFHTDSAFQQDFRQLLAVDCGVSLLITADRPGIIPRFVWTAANFVVYEPAKHNLLHVDLAFFKTLVPASVDLDTLCKSLQASGADLVMIDASMHRDFQDRKEAKDSAVSVHKTNSWPVWRTCHIEERYDARQTRTIWHRVKFESKSADKAFQGPALEIKSADKKVQLDVKSTDKEADDSRDAVAKAATVEHKADTKFDSQSWMSLISSPTLQNLAGSLGVLGMMNTGVPGGPTTISGVMTVDPMQTSNVCSAFVAYAADGFAVQVAAPIVTAAPVADVVPLRQQQQEDAEKKRTVAPVIKLESRVASDLAIVPLAARPQGTEEKRVTCTTDKWQVPPEFYASVLRMNLASAAKAKQAAQDLEKLTAFLGNHILRLVCETISYEDPRDDQFINVAVKFLLETCEKDSSVSTCLGVDGGAFYTALTAAVGRIVDAGYTSSLVKFDAAVRAFTLSLV
jgi:hypothetical protein